MIDIRFFDLLGLRLTHDYFGKAPDGAIEVRPAWSVHPPGLPGAKFLAQHAAGRVFEPGDGAKSALHGALPLPFALILRDPAFPLYTAGASGAAFDKTVAVFDNLTAVTGDGVTVIHRQDTDIRRVVLHGATFRHSLADGLSGNEVRAVRRADKAVVFERRAAGAPFSGALDLDLRGAADGRYALFLDDAEILDFMLLRRRPPGLFGLVEIYAGGPDQEVPAAARAVATDGTLTAPAPKTYEIQFAARRTRWRYWLTPASNDSDLAGWKVRRKGGAPDGRFGAPTRTGPEDPAPWRLDATEAIALGLSTGPDLELVPPGGERAIALPRPGPHALAQDRNGAVSEIFVRL